MTIRWGIIGPGTIAHRFAEALSAVDGTRLHAVASRSRERSEAFRQKWGGETAYGEYEDLVADPQVDAVYVATPHRYHFENVMRCLEAGKHVLCEKPLAVNELQAADMVGLARDRGLFLLEALWSRFLPIYRLAETWIREGRIGEVRQVNSSFSFLDKDRNPEGRLLNIDLAGGALLDLGVYNIAMSQWAFGRDPDRVAALGYIGETSVDEIVCATLDYGQGRLAQFTCGFRANMVNELTVYGTNGRIRIDEPFWGADTATLLSDGEVTTATRKPIRNGFEYQIEETARCIRAGLVESAAMPHAATVANARLMDEIRQQIGLSYPFE